jgi:polysaccharide biosynthesis/export protein
LVYIIGEVGKVGCIELGERDSITVVQALAQSSGFSRDANRGRVRILRPVENTNRRAEIDINVNRILEGKDNDFPLLPNDLLYVSRSYSRQIWTTIGQLAISTLPVTLITLVLR